MPLLTARAAAPSAPSGGHHHHPLHEPPEPQPPTLADADVHVDIHDPLTAAAEQQQQHQHHNAPQAQAAPQQPHHPPTARHHNAQLGHGRFGRGGAHLTCAELPSLGVEVFVVTPDGDERIEGAGARGSLGAGASSAGKGDLSPLGRAKGFFRTVAATAVLALAAVLGRGGPGGAGGGPGPPPPTAGPPPATTVPRC